MFCGEILIITVLRGIGGKYVINYSGDTLWEVLFMVKIFMLKIKRIFIFHLLILMSMFVSTGVVI